MTRRKALVVDDDAAIRLLVKRILMRNDFDVHVARDGAECLELLQTDHFDVIVLDLMMPRIDGVSVVKYIAQHHP